jgi:hypothetical protein
LGNAGATGLGAAVVNSFSLLGQSYGHQAGKGRMMRKRSLCAFSVLGTLLPAAYASAQVPRVIYSDIVTSPTSDVPGLPGAKFSSFDRPFSSPDGSRWIFSADTDLATTSDEVIVLGSGLSGTTVVQEGVTQVAPPSTELAGLIDLRLWVTNAGDFVYATNTDNAVTTADEVIGRRVGATYDVPAREGDPAPGIPGATIGLNVHSGYLADDGRVGFLSTSLLGTGSTSTDSAAFFGNTVIAQEGITVPGNQAGGGTATWQLFDFEGFYMANNGATHLLRGDTNAAVGDDVLVYNGNVVLQEAEIIPGSGFTSPIATGGSVEDLLTANGDWFSRGANADAIDWVVRNGTVLASTDTPVPGGIAGETFDDATFAATFFSMAGNGSGDYVYGGVTSNPDLNANAVLVFNNDFVLIREGDPVDVDGNGVFDDNAFISVFNNEDAFLTDDLRYFFTADLRDSAGVALGQAFIVMPVPEPGALSLLAIGAIGLLRRRRAA